MKGIILLIIFLSNFYLSISEAAVPLVKSWSDYTESDIEILNNEITKANKKGESWISKPNLYVFNLFSFYGIAKYKTKFYFDTGIDPSYLTVSVSMHDIKGDDSIRGHIYQVMLSRKKNEKIWQIDQVRNTYRCWRGENTNDFTGKLCL